jgi:hypothetical protein
MPKSKLRKKTKKVIPADVLHPVALPKESPKWLAPVMVGAYLDCYFLCDLNKLPRARYRRLEHGYRLRLYRSWLLIGNEMALRE